MGVHAIRFLERGRYWGFDIDQALLDEGARLIGPEMETKAPNLRVISASSVREAAQAKPALLVSLKVLVHARHPHRQMEFWRAVPVCAAKLGALSGTPQGGRRAKGRSSGRARTDIVAEAKTGTLEVRAAR